MRLKMYTFFAAMVFAASFMFVFFPANEVEAPKVQQSPTNTKRIIPNQTETNASKQLVNMNSIQYGENLVKKLNKDPSLGLIKHKRNVTSHYQNHEVTVKFKKEPNKLELIRIAKAINGEVAKKLDSTYIFRSNVLTTPELIDFFKTKKYVLFAEPNYIYLQNSININDKFYKEYQWNLPAIHTEAGWDISKGTEDIVIAIIDTGVDMKHPDLVHRLTDGYNVLNGSAMPIDDNGHGTHVAGIIASEINNDVGIAGMTWFNQIMPIKAMNADGTGTAFDVSKGIRWATDHGADVINLSLGNYKASKAMKEAIDYAYKKDVVLIAATGNDNTDQKSYPSAFDHVLGVAAVNLDLKRAPFSNFGDHVDVAAPGVDIASTYLKGQYASLSGTSMATPHVSSLAGLIKSYNPKLKNTEILEVIKETSDDTGQRGYDIYTGNGLINISSALEAVYKTKYPLGKVSEWLQQ